MSSKPYGVSTFKGKRMTPACPYMIRWGCCWVTFLKAFTTEKRPCPTSVVGWYEAVGVMDGSNMRVLPSTNEEDLELGNLTRW